MAKKYGYHCESHLITTEDGYILEIHRISKNLETGKLNQDFTYPMSAYTDIAINATAIKKEHLGRFAETKKTHKIKDRGQPLLIFPCLAGSSASYSYLPSSMAYTLVDDGYDVWLGN